MSAARPIEDQGTRLGMLLEAAHTQQELITTGIEQFRALAQGFDEVVRGQIRRTLTEELGAVGEEVQRVLTVLNAVEGAAQIRSLRVGVLMVVLSLAASIGVAWWWLPSHHEIGLLRAQRDAMRSEIDALSASGGAVELRRCGSEQRWCVRVDRRGPAYGADSDFLLVKGH